MFFRFVARHTGRSLWPVLWSIGLATAATGATAAPTGAMLDPTRPSDPTSAAMRDLVPALSTCVPEGVAPGRLTVRVLPDAGGGPSLVMVMKEPTRLVFAPNNPGFINLAKVGPADGGADKQPAFVHAPSIACMTKQIASWKLPVVDERPRELTILGGSKTTYVASSVAFQLTKQTVTAVLAPVHPVIATCVDRARAEGLAIADEVKASLVVERDGHLTIKAITPDAPDALGRCVRQALTSVTFPWPSPGPLPIELPFRVSAHPK